MDTFKGQDNDDLREHCAKNNCEIMIIRQNLTNKFQPLDLTANKAAKACISEKCSNLDGKWNFKTTQKRPSIIDVKVSLLSSVVKTLHAKWIVNLYHHLKADKEMIVNGFRAAGISKAIENAHYITEKV